MATLSGILSVSNGESRLSGQLLARQNTPDPLGEATNFLANRGLGDGDPTTVTGNNGSLGSAPVFYIVTAASAPQSDKAVLADSAAVASPQQKGAKKKKKKAKTEKVKKPETGGKE